MIKCHYDSKTGRILGFYKDGVHKSIPVPHIELDADAHAKIGAAPKTFRVNLGTFEIEPFRPDPPSHEDQRNAAFLRVDRLHARLLSELMENASDQESRTWPAKTDAARALIAKLASDSQEAMLADEASALGISPIDLAHKILRKADRYLGLIGTAAGLRAKARREIEEATQEYCEPEAMGEQVALVLSDLSTAIGNVLAEERAGGPA